MPGSRIIVFPTDFSEESLQSLGTAKQMAEALGTSLHLVHVVEETHIYSALEMGALPFPTENELKTGAESRFEKLLAEHSLPADTKMQVLAGRSARAIVDYSNDVDAQMIVMTTHGYGGFQHMLLGSTTEAVVRAAECPVLSVRAKR